MIDIAGAKARLLFVIFLAIFIDFPAGAAFAQTTGTIFGMNFNFDWVDEAKIPQCGPRNRIAPARSHGFLRRYDDPATRNTVRRELANMRRAGFAEIRTLVWFGKSAERSPDVFPLETPETATRNVSLFADDVREAGFSRLHLGFGPQGTAAVSCRRQQWGDCFDQETVASTVHFITVVRQALSAPTAAIIDVDLQNEGGLTHFHPAAMRTNMVAYLSKLVGAYLRRFPDDRTTISLQGRQLAERLAFVLHIYENVRRWPAFLDIHIYDTTPSGVAVVSDALRSLPQPLPMMIGEFPYGDRGAVRMLESQLSRYQSKNTPVIFWPLRNPTGACGVDTPPPYDLIWMGRE